MSNDVPHTLHSSTQRCIVQQDDLASCCCAEEWLEWHDGLLSEGALVKRCTGALNLGKTFTFSFAKAQLYRQLYLWQVKINIQ